VGGNRSLAVRQLYEVKQPSKKSASQSEYRPDLRWRSKEKVVQSSDSCVHSQKNYMALPTHCGLLGPYQARHAM
jgi:hypothetical protein